MNYPIIVSLDQRYFDKEKHLFLKGSPVFESLTKDDRPYVEGTLVADEMNTYFVPFRSHVDPNFAKKHSEAVVTLRTKLKPDAGLDIRKMLVVGNDTELKVRRRGIDKEQYNILLRKQDELWNKVEKYVSEYQREVRAGERLRPEYRYTSLRNFHKELGLEKMEQQTERELDLENLKQLQEDGKIDEGINIKHVADQLPAWRESDETSDKELLAKYGRDKDLDRLVRDKNWEVRRAVAEAGRDKDLLKLMKDRNSEVRHDAEYIYKYGIERSDNEEENTPELLEKRRAA